MANSERNSPDTDTDVEDLPGLLAEKASISIRETATQNLSSSQPLHSFKPISSISDAPTRSPRGLRRHATEGTIFPSKTDSQGRKPTLASSQISAEARARRFAAISAGLGVSQTVSQVEVLPPAAQEPGSSIQRTPRRAKTEPTKVVDVSDDELSEVESRPSTQPLSSFVNPQPLTRETTLDSLFEPTSTTTSMSSVVTTPELTIDSSRGSSGPNTDLVPISVREFARASWSSDLKVETIAFCERTQSLLDGCDIAWGVQYELARGVTQGLWTWDDVVKEKIDRLKGTNAVSAYRVEQVIRGTPKLVTSVDCNLWAELDREQKSIDEGQGRGLGLMGEFEGVPHWYGGKIQQIAKLVKQGATYKVVLERMESCRSHRFARQYGSRRFLQLRVSEDIRNNEAKSVKKYLERKFNLCGRIFVPFHSKEGSTYLIETNEAVSDVQVLPLTNDSRVSLNEFINTFNPLEENYDQQMVGSHGFGAFKFKPCLEFSEDDIHFIPDISASTSSLFHKEFFLRDLTCSRNWLHKPEAPPEHIMTDGCGFVNFAALDRIRRLNHRESMPAASKVEFVEIWIRDSQRKIKYKSLQRAHRIFELVAVSQASPSQAITPQSIINLHANGVPADVLEGMMEASLEADIAPLLEWDGPHAMKFLYQAIAKAGSVSSARTQRVVSSLNRVLGFKGREWNDKNEDDEGDENIPGSEDKSERPTAYTGRNEYSGEPLSKHEQAMELIQAGFHPAKLGYLRDRIKFIVESVIEKATENIRIPLPKSTSGFIVPDPLGILKEGEVAYTFSRPTVDPDTGLLMYCLEGDILVGRYPIRLPSDIQKVRAVRRPELGKWPDVLIVSTQGAVSLASMLSGGDLDGDEPFGSKDEVLVQYFRSKPVIPQPKGFLEENFVVDVEKVKQFCDRVAGLPRRESDEALQAVLVGNLKEVNVGLYSGMHGRSALKHGYDHPKTIRLAQLFNILVDANKSGLHLKAGVFERDQKEFSFHEPKSPTAAGTDILEILKAAAQRKGQELLGLCADRFNSRDKFEYDPALAEPYTFLNNLVLNDISRQQILKEQLSKIRKHVQPLEEEFCGKWAQRAEQKKNKAVNQDSRLLQDKRPNTFSWDITRRFWEPIPGLTHIRDQNEVKVAYAYELRKNKSPKFAFTVGHSHLCSLMSKTSPGGFASSTRTFDEGKTLMASSYVRALKNAQDLGA